MLERFDDIHTHRPDAGPRAVKNLGRGEAMRDGVSYSAGVHPWDSDAADVAARFAEVEALVADSRVVMVGECGVDKRRGADVGCQLELLKRHALLAERAGKPLLLHVVGAYPEVIRLHAELRPRQPWIIHGFRGKPQLACELLRHGFGLSVGERFNADSVRVIPDESLYVETDESTMDIEEIRMRVDAARIR